MSLDQTLIVGGIVFLAVFTQSLSGFGSGLVAMALLPGLIGLRVASPLVALMGATLEFILLIRYRAAINLRAVWRLILAAAISIPLGVIFLRSVDGRIALTGLGVVLLGYALYALMNFKLPRLANPRWAYAFGFVAGLLGGAYNTSGPPVVIYGSSQEWQPPEFKGNLQSFFLLNSALVVASHALDGNFSAKVWRTYALTLPALALGMLAGLWLDRFLNLALFRKMVLILLVLLGLRMVL